MIQEGHIALFTLPRPDQGVAKPRPALVLRQVPGPANDWLVCMISSQALQRNSVLDETIYREDPDFAATGLNVSSVIRVTRLAVASGENFHGAVGQLAPERLQRIRARLAEWLRGPAS